LRRILLLAGILFLLSAKLIQAQEDCLSLSRFNRKEVFRVERLHADVNVHFDIEALKAPDMQAKLYFKAPDKNESRFEKNLFLFLRKAGFSIPFSSRKRILRRDFSSA